ncbi:hypothetical protein EBB07_06795 [Paenibacillaceae bacterium]|nr:hypothetical protein EBB07_06795 [Paenibacillaceae bacterium]
MNFKTGIKKWAVGALSLAIVATSSFGFAGGGIRTFAAEGGVAQAYESIFAGDRIIDVKVTIEDKDWKSILESPLDKEYKNVSVEVDGKRLDNVGFSTKGNSSLRSVAGMTDSDRYSFRLKFDKYDKQQTLLGLDKLALNNNYADPSYLREYLHYEALREIGLDAPLTVFANLYINGELYGFYTGVESIDDSYLKRTAGDDYADGVLYDTAEGTRLQYEKEGKYSSITYDLGVEDDKASLKNFIQVLNDMPDGAKGEIESVLDVDSALKYIAANAVLGNYDSYNGDKAHNFQLYGDSAGKFTIIPWDFNMSFNGYGGGRRTVASADTAANTPVNTNAITAFVDVPVLGVGMEAVPMINNLLKVMEYKAKYLQYVNELVEYLGGIEDRISSLGELIEPYVDADPTKFYSVEQFQANITYSADGGDDNGNLILPPGFEGRAFPEAAEGRRAREAMDGMPPFEGDTARERPADEKVLPTEARGEQGQRPGNGMGMGGMTAGSIMTFALNRLVNLQEQLGLEVSLLPVATGSTAGEEQGVDSVSGAEAEGGAHAGTGNYTVVLDGKKVNFPDQQPIYKSGRVLVPAQVIFEALGAETAWDGTTKTLIATLGEESVVLAIGSETAYVNGEAVKLDIPAEIIGNRMVVPVRFVSEALNRKVSWSNATATATISTK